VFSLQKAGEHERKMTEIETGNTVSSVKHQGITLLKDFKQKKQEQMKGKRKTSLKS